MGFGAHFITGKKSLNEAHRPNSRTNSRPICFLANVAMEAANANSFSIIKPAISNQAEERHGTSALRESNQ